MQNGACYILQNILSNSTQGSALFLGQIKKNTNWSSCFFFQKEEDEGLFILYLFFLFSKMAAKHFNSKWPPTFQFKITDSFLFIAILQVESKYPFYVFC